MGSEKKEKISESPGAADNREASSLLARAHLGDEEALIALLASQAPALRQAITIARKWRPIIEVEDVIQMTFSEAFLRFDQFVGSHPRALTAWLTTIAKNNVRAGIRGLESAKRPHPDRRLVTAGAPGRSHEDLLQDIGVSTATPSRFAAKDEACRAIKSSLEKLPPDYATVIRLYYFEGLTGENLAEAMNRSRGAASMLLARARDRLAEVMGTPSLFFTDTP